MEFHAFEAAGTGHVVIFLSVKTSSEIPRIFFSSIPSFLPLKFKLEVEVERAKARLESSGQQLARYERSLQVRTEEWRTHCRQHGTKEVFVLSTQMSWVRITSKSLENTT